MKLRIQKRLGLIPSEVTAEITLEALPTALAQAFLRMREELAKHTRTRSADAVPDSSQLKLTLTEQDAATGESRTQRFVFDETQLPAEFIDLLDEIWAIAIDPKRSR